MRDSCSRTRREKKYEIRELNATESRCQHCCYLNKFTDDMIKNKRIKNMLTRKPKNLCKYRWWIDLRENFHNVFKIVSQICKKQNLRDF